MYKKNWDHEALGKKWKIEGNRGIWIVDMMLARHRKSVRKMRGGNGDGELQLLEEGRKSTSRSPRGHFSML